ncbi:MAG: hypothetical protein ACOCUD_01620 [Bacillota bacterium]
MTKIKKIDEFNQEDYIKIVDGKEIISLSIGSFEVNCGDNCEINCWKDCEINCCNDCEINCGDNCEINCGDNCEIDCWDKCEIDCYNDCEINCCNDCEITASEGTKVTAWFKGNKFNYTFEERKKIKFEDGKFLEEEEFEITTNCGKIPDKFKKDLEKEE